MYRCGTCCVIVGVCRGVGPPVSAVMCVEVWELLCLQLVCVEVWVLLCLQLVCVEVGACCVCSWCV